MDSSQEVLVTTNVLGEMEQINVTKQYLGLLEQLHKRSVDMDKKQFRKVFHDFDTIPMFVIVRDTEIIIATAQASLAWTLPQYHVYINNVVIHENYRRQGFGKAIMDSLEREIYDRWGCLNGSPLKLELTNSPSKNNAGFYESLGYTSRTKESGDETVVWVKDV